MTHYFELRYARISLLIGGGLLFFVYVSLFPLIVFAANEVTIDENTTLVLPSDSTEYTLAGGSKFDSLTINNANFEFVLSAQGKATLKSSARKIFTTSDINKSTTCGSDESSIIIELDPGNSDGKTITITPSSSICAAVSSVSGGGGGGGGGGGTTVSSLALATPVQEESVPVPTPIKAVPASSAVFISNLGFGMQNNDVTRLQILLARDLSVYPEGRVTGYFGLLTQKAVERFQLKFGIASQGVLGFGRVGPKTRAKLAEVFGETGAIPTVPGIPSFQPPAISSIEKVSSIFNISLRFGMISEDIRRLQKILNSDPDTRIAETGVGSSGNETNYFGVLTLEAVKKFQTKQNIASSGDENTTGYGLVGPKTRLKLQEVFGGI